MDSQKKWPASRLHRTKKTMGLIRGNGYQYVMVILGHEDPWDLEAMSSARLKTRPETHWVYLTLATFWTALFITVSGLKEYSWFLIGIGGLGTLQNIYVAAAAAKPEELKHPPSALPGSLDCQDTRWTSPLSGTFAQQIPDPLTRSKTTAS
jgi:hypothetical protein